MHITSVRFVKSAVGRDEVLEDGIPQIAFIGRSNVGKSSVINALAKQDICKTSSFPGRTQLINIFLINKILYLIDLPGYGYAKVSHAAREHINGLISWYLFDSKYDQKKIVFIVDVKVGLTKSDQESLCELEKAGKDIIIVANKIDALGTKALAKQLKAIQGMVGDRKVLPFSAKKNTGVNALAELILS
jgi:GTP-binding protein